MKIFNFSINFPKITVADGKSVKIEIKLEI